MQIEWTYVKNTDNKYIILSTGKIFSARKCDYITPYLNKNNTLFYRLKFADGIRSVSVNTLLKEHFNDV